MKAIAQDYPEDVQDMLRGLEAFLRAEVFSRHEKYEAILTDPRRKYAEDGRFSADTLAILTEVRMAAAEAGYYNLCVPEELGGGGFGMVAYFAFWEHVFHLCGARYWLGHSVGSHWSRGPSPVLRGMSRQARETLMPDILSGRATLCFGLSEPNAGSDAVAIRTKAVPDGDGWRLSGTKIWTTNSPHAEHAMIFAVTDPERAAQRKGGISLFLVPTNARGFVIERIIKMFGSPGGDEAVLHFDDIRIEPHQLVGELHKGFEIAMLGVSLGRLYNAARGVGLGRWALEMAFDYAKVRQAFGRPISEYQGVTFPLAESAMEVHAAHLMSRNVAQLLDAGLPATKELSMTKSYSVRVGARAVDRVIQTHGAMGLTNEMYLTDAYVILRKVNIADGTNQIMNRTIVRRMLDGDVDL
ncbi:MAG: acyl-CoA dehydrogenase family protein [Bacteroidota bacterium]|jgi:acyl-CoA dehydrogenase